MGNNFICCKKDYTVQKNAELSLQLDTCHKKRESDINGVNGINGINGINGGNGGNNLNRTLKRNSYIDNKNNQDLGDMRTEANDSSSLKNKDDFMKSYAKLLINLVLNINKQNSFEDECLDNDISRLHNYIETNTDNLPNLIINITKENDTTVKKMLHMTPLGVNVEGSSNREKVNKIDGITYFGVDKDRDKDKDKNFNQISYNDVILPLDYTEYEDLLSLPDNSLYNYTYYNKINPNISNTESFRLFGIRFNTDTNKFCIRDFLSGLPTFAQVKNETVLKNNCIINIGDSYVFLNFGDCDDKSNQIESTSISMNNNNYNNVIQSQSEHVNTNSELINIKVFNRKSQLIHEPINFQPSKSSIKLGRNKDNEIVINDSMVSKTHCTIQYDKVVGWTIRDGIWKPNSEFVPSTNGTWLYIGDNCPIVDGMVFRCASLFFECNLSFN